jgi:hypothetical protein
MKRPAITRLMGGPGSRRRPKSTGITPIRSIVMEFGRLKTSLFSSGMGNRSKDRFRKSIGTEDLLVIPYYF